MPNAANHNRLKPQDHQHCCQHQHPDANQSQSTPFAAVCLFLRQWGPGLFLGGALAPSRFIPIINYVRPPSAVLRPSPRGTPGAANVRDSSAIYGVSTDSSLGQACPAARFSACQV
jgi:hypothetical protein